MAGILFFRNGRIEHRYIKNRLNEIEGKLNRNGGAPVLDEDEIADLVDSVKCLVDDKNIDDKIDAAVAEVEEKYEDLKDEHDAELTINQGKIAQRDNTIGQQDDAIKILQGKISGLNQDINNLEKTEEEQMVRIKELESIVNSQTYDLGELVQRLEDGNDSINNLEKEIDDLNARLALV